MKLLISKIIRNILFERKDMKTSIYEMIVRSKKLPDTQRILVDSKHSIFKNKVVSKSIINYFDELEEYQKLLLVEEINWKIVNIKDNPEYFI